jgi:hypothetical protein
MFRKTTQEDNRVNVRRDVGIGGSASQIWGGGGGGGCLVKEKSR